MIQKTNIENKKPSATIAPTQQPLILPNIVNNKEISTTRSNSDQAASLKQERSKSMLAIKHNNSST